MRIARERAISRIRTLTPYLLVPQFSTHSGPVEHANPTVAPIEYAEPVVATSEYVEFVDDATEYDSVVAETNFDDLIKLFSVRKVSQSWTQNPRVAAAVRSLLLESFDAYATTSDLAVLLPREDFISWCAYADDAVPISRQQKSLKCTRAIRDPIIGRSCCAKNNTPGTYSASRCLFSGAITAVSRDQEMATYVAKGGPPGTGRYNTNQCFSIDLALLRSATHPEAKTLLDGLTANLIRTAPATAPGKRTSSAAGPAAKRPLRA